MTSPSVKVQPVAVRESESGLRVTVVQPALAKYRIPVFRELASRSGIDLKVVYGETAGLQNVEADGFNAVSAPMSTLRLLGQNVLFHGAQWRFASRKQSDVLLLTWTPRYLTLAPALLRARLSGVKTLLWGHGFSKSDRLWWRFIRQLLARLSDGLLFYDTYTASQFEQAGWPAERLFVAPNAIDHSEIEAAKKRWLAKPERLVDFRKEQQLGDGPIILYVSRLLPANRVDLLIEATALLAADNPTLKTVIIGNGLEQRAQLQQMCGDLGISHQVIFQDGIYNEEKLAPWFLTSTVFCYPENIGLSIVHALRYGLPVVTSDKRECHNPEIVYLEPDANGMTYEHGSVDSLTDTLAGLLNDQQKRRSLAIAAANSVESKVTVSKMVDGMVTAIKSVGRSNR